MKIRPEMPLDRAALIGCGVTTGLGAALSTAAIRAGRDGGRDRLRRRRVSRRSRAAGSPAPSRIVAVDTVPWKLDLAKELGATETVDAAQGDPTSAVLEMRSAAASTTPSSASARRRPSAQAVAMVKKGGAAVLVGVVPVGATARASRARHRAPRQARPRLMMGENRFRIDMPRYVDLYLDGRLKLDEMISARLPLDQIHVAFEKMKSGEVARSVVTFTALSHAEPRASVLRLDRASTAAWAALAALALFAWRQGIGFALSDGGAQSVETILFDAADNPPWLLAIVAAALLVSRARDVRAAVGAPGSPLRAAALFAPGLALAAWARFVDAPELALLGTLAMALAAAYAAAGARLLRILALPLLLLAFAVPIPGVLVNAVVHPAQLVTSAYAHGLLTAIGVTAVRSADVIRTASHAFVVIEGCSGLGSMEVLTLLALAWGWQTKAPLWRCVVLALAAPVIAFVLNGFRVVALVLFPENPVWSGHTVQGIVTFAIGSLCIAALDRLLEGRSAPPAARPLGTARASAARPPRSLAAWLVIAAVLSLAVPRYALPSPRARGKLLPENSEPWRSAPREIDRLYLGSVHLNRGDRRIYVADPAPPETTSGNGKPRAEAFVGENWRRYGATSLRSAKNRLPGRGWRIEEESIFSRAGTEVERTLALSDSRRILSWTWYVNLDSPPVEALRAFLSLERSPFRHKQHAFVVRLTSEVLPDEKDTAFAERRLQSLDEAVAPTLEYLTGLVER